MVVVFVVVVVVVVVVVFVVVVGSVVVPIPVHNGCWHDPSQPLGQLGLHGQASLQAKKSRLHVDVHDESDSHAFRHRVNLFVQLPSHISSKSRSLKADG